MKYRLLFIGLAILTLATVCGAQPLNPPKTRPDIPFSYECDFKSDILAGLKQQIAQKEHKRRLALREYLPDSYKVRSLEAEIATLRSRLKRAQSASNGPAPLPNARYFRAKPHLLRLTVPRLR